MPLRAALTGTALAATFFLAVVEPAVAQNVVSDIALAGSGRRRKPFASMWRPDFSSAAWWMRTGKIRAPFTVVARDCRRRRNR